MAPLQLSTTYIFIHDLYMIADLSLSMTSGRYPSLEDFATIAEQ